MNSHVVQQQHLASERSSLVFHRSTVMERLMEQADRLRARVLRAFSPLGLLLFHRSTEYPPICEFS